MKRPRAEDDQNVHSEMSALRAELNQQTRTMLALHQKLNDLEESNKGAKETAPPGTNQNTSLKELEFATEDFLSLKEEIVRLKKENLTIYDKDREIERLKKENLALYEKDREIERLKKEILALKEALKEKDREFERVKKQNLALKENNFALLREVKPEGN